MTVTVTLDPDDVRIIKYVSAVFLDSIEGEDALVIMGVLFEYRFLLDDVQNMEVTL